MNINSDIYRLIENGKSYKDVQDYIRWHYGENLSKDAIRKRYSRRVERANMPEIPTAHSHDLRSLVDIRLDGNIMFFGDLHLPFTMKGYIEYGLKLYDRYDCRHCLFIGDLFDQYANSAWDKDPEALDAYSEFRKAKKAFSILKDYMDFAYVTPGNHDLRFLRTAVRQGIPSYLVRTFEEVYNIPESWQLAESFVINDDILVEHGTGSGPNATYERARDEGINVVQGHTHSYAQIRYLNTSYRGMRWAMNIGCGVDDSHYSMKYASNKKYKSTLGYGFIIDGNPVWFPYKGS